MCAFYEDYNTEHCLWNFDSSFVRILCYSQWIWHKTWYIFSSLSLWQQKLTVILWCICFWIMVSDGTSKPPAALSTQLTTRDNGWWNEEVCVHGDPPAYRLGEPHPVPPKWPPKQVGLSPEFWQWFYLYILIYRFSRQHSPDFCSGHAEFEWYVP